MASEQPCPFCGAQLGQPEIVDGVLGLVRFHPGTVTDGSCIMAGKGITSTELQAWNQRAGTVRDFIAYVAKVSEAIGFQAGVGGRETAGAIIGFLAQHPDQLEVFMKEGVFGWDDTEWITGGCLTWQANDGKVWHPDDARAARDAAQSAQGDR